MKQILMVLFVLFFSAACGKYDPQNSSLDFYSADSYLVDIKFKDYFLIPKGELSKPYETVRRMNDLAAVDRKKVLEVMKLHGLHLYGVFTYHEKPVDFSSYSGAILEKRPPKISKLSQNEKYIRVDYRFNDEAIFYWELLNDDVDVTAIKFYMPNVPTKVYKAGFPTQPVLDPKTQKPINTCSDHHDNSEAAFWYYWSPDRKGCEEKFKDHLHLVKNAKLHFKGETIETYPDYRKLFKLADEENNDIQIDVIVGQDEKFGDDNDLGRKTFEHTFGLLKNMKTSAGEGTYKVRRDSEFLKRVEYKTDQFKATINLHYVDTETEKFDDLARKTLVESDFFVFSGHSYEGYYFQLDRLFDDPKDSLAKGKYQIMFFNACTTLSYYNDKYFEAKKYNNGPDDRDLGGTKYLDLVTNGIGSPFMLDARSTADQSETLNLDVVLINNLLGLDKTGAPVDRLLSWQQIMQNLSDTVGYDFTALTSVNGDHDNPKRLAADLKVPVPL